MSLLAPLYFAGLLAISLPILFHLIRRTPQGRREFSSLMFLAPSPPRITRRSRLDNLLLLLLRAAALGILAFAFARPFLFNNSQANLTGEQGKRVAILVDVSASMQRGDLRDQASRQVDQVLADLKPQDEVALYVFDQRVRAAMTFEEWTQTALPQRVPALQARLKATPQTWAGTNIGSSLATLADLLGDVRGTSAGAADAAARQIVLITDLQQGGHSEALQTHQWPANVALEVRRVNFANSSNAGIQTVKDIGDSSLSAEPQLRVRITNQPGSTKDQFSLRWAGNQGPISGLEPVSAYVPAGRSQILRVPWPRGAEGSNAADRLILSGDEADFDNTLYIVPPRVDAVRIAYIGDDVPADTRAMRFYLEKVVVPTPQRTVEVTGLAPDASLVASQLTDTRLVVVASPLADPQVDALRQFADQGGTVLWVLKDLAAAQGLSRLARIESLAPVEAQSGEFVLISRVSLDHPLFAPFADARFSDFTKIHFWKHRQIKLDGLGGMKPLAWFDNGDPFMLEQSIGSGRLLVMTSGWQPADSQLALSTKFVPLVDGLLARRDAAMIESQYAVGEAIPLLPATADQTRAIVAPDGASSEILKSATAFSSTDRPGIYRLKSGTSEIPIAVNVSADESRTMPLAAEDLEQWGAKLGNKPVSEQVIAKQQQLQISELEGRQKLWRWGIAAVLGLLAIETVVAGRLARRTIEQQVTT